MNQPEAETYALSILAPDAYTDPQTRAAIGLGYQEGLKVRSAELMKEIADLRTRLDKCRELCDEIETGEWCGVRYGRGETSTEEDHEEFLCRFRQALRTEDAPKQPDLSELRETAGKSIKEMADYWDTESRRMCEMESGKFPPSRMLRDSMAVQYGKTREEIDAAADETARRRDEKGGELHGFET